MEVSSKSWEVWSRVQEERITQHFMRLLKDAHTVIHFPCFVMQYTKQTTLTHTCHGGHIDNNSTMTSTTGSPHELYGQMGTNKDTCLV